MFGFKLIYVVDTLDCVTFSHNKQAITITDNFNYVTKKKKKRFSFDSDRFTENSWCVETFILCVLSELDKIFGEKKIGHYLFTFVSCTFLFFSLICYYFVYKKK